MNDKEIEIYVCRGAGQKSSLVINGNLVAGPGGPYGPIVCRWTIPLSELADSLEHAGGITRRNAKAGIGRKG